MIMSWPFGSFIVRTGHIVLQKSTRTLMSSNLSKIGIWSTKMVLWLWLTSKYCLISNQLFSKDLGYFTTLSGISVIFWLLLKTTDWKPLFCRCFKSFHNRKYSCDIKGIFKPLEMLFLHMYHIDALYTIP